jgi:PAS domain S-box-containing protein
MPAHGGTGPRATRGPAAAANDRAVRDLLARCPIPVLLVRLPDGLIVGASNAAQRLLGGAEWRSDPLIGYDALAFHQDPAPVRARLKQVRDGQIDGYHARRHLRSAGAADVVADVWVSVSPDGEHREFATAVVLPLQDGPRDQPHEPASPPPESQTVVGLVDDGWRMTQVGPGLQSMLGYQPDRAVGVSVLALVHQADVARLLAASADAVAGPRQVTLALRLRSADGTWVVCRLHIVPLAGGTDTAFAFVLSSGADAALPQRERLAHFSARLRAIALELELAARPGAGPDPAGRATPLTPREAEIVARVLDGERVPGIARALYVAQSTVRNHLSATFAKLGVHSQEALVAHFRGPASSAARPAAVPARPEDPPGPE